MRLRSSVVLFPSLAALALAACGDPASSPPASAPAQAPVQQTPSAPPILTRDQIEGGVPTANSGKPAPAAASTTSPTRPTQAPANGQAAPGATPADVNATPPDAGLLRLQILLDRAAFSPGQIDGLHGENTRQAIAAYRQAKNLGSGDVADAALIQSLTATDTAPVTTQYTLTQQDAAGPFSPPPAGEDLSAQAAQGTHFSTPLEGIAERFHISEALLQALNPGVNFAAAGSKIVVPVIRSQPLPQVARIEVDKSEKAVKAFDASGALVAFLPATIGSGDNPTPTGNLRVNGVAPEPDYLYDPSRLTFGKGGEKVTVPAGPNNPVGSVWIDLSRDTYGIHGTPDPSKIGKTASHGCVRLTNWDAERLAAAVKPGVSVRFT